MRISVGREDSPQPYYPTLKILYHIIIGIKYADGTHTYTFKFYYNVNVNRHLQLWQIRALRQDVYETSRIIYLREDCVPWTLKI